MRNTLFIRQDHLTDAICPYCDDPIISDYDKFGGKLIHQSCLAQLQAESEAIRLDDYEPYSEVYQEEIYRS